MLNILKSRRSDDLYTAAGADDFAKERIVAKHHSFGSQGNIFVTSSMSP
jgi:hypothetical protein